jgi:hypothetical protein
MSKAGRGAPDLAAQETHDLRLLREAPYLLLREDDLAVGEDVELAVLALLRARVVPVLL